jgi:hypothetical protein
MSKLTKDIYKKYFPSLGSEQIASPKALRIIERFTKKFIQEIEITSTSNLSINTSQGLVQDGNRCVYGGGDSR